jgi:hypothetical protein
MAKTLHVAGNNPALSIGAGNTRYLPAHMTRLGQSTTNAGPEEKAAGTYRDLYVLVVTNNTSAQSTFTFQKNGANGGMSLTVNSGAVGKFRDTSGSEAVVANDDCTVKVVNGGGGSLDVSIVAVSFDAATNTRLIAAPIAFGVTAPTASATYFFCPGGGNFSPSTTEADWQARVQGSGKLVNLQWNVTLNGRSTTSTARVRKNGSNGNLNVPVSGGATGLFADNSSEDTYAAGDLLCLSIDFGTGTGDIEGGGTVVFETTDSTYHTIYSAPACFEDRPSSTSRHPLAGSGPSNANTAATAAVDKIDVEAPAAATWSHLSVYVKANGNTSNATVTIKSGKNGSDGNQSVAINTGTGWFMDSTNTDSVAAGDDLYYSMVPNNGLGVVSFTLGTIVSKFTTVLATLNIVNRTVLEYD